MRYGHDLLYGVRKADLEYVSKRVETVMKMVLTKHSSSTRGGDYFRLDESEVELIVQRNYDCVDETPAEPDYPQMSTLIYVSGGDDVFPITQLLESEMPEIVLVRRHTQATPGT